MMQKGIAIFYCCLLLQVSWAQEFFKQAKAENFIAGKILVQLQPNVSITSFINFLQEKNYESQANKQLSKSWNMWLIDVSEGKEKEILALSKTCKLVETAQLNHRLSKRNVVPNDTQYGNQWGLNNSGQNGGTVGADVEAQKAWQFTTGGLTANGDTIVIAIIDGGIDLQHEDLNLWKNRFEIRNNNIDDDANGYIDDYDGWNCDNNSGQLNEDRHGTHVAGIAGAKGNNAKGVAGVNWNVKIMPIQVNNYTDAEVASAYSYVFDMRKRYNETNGAEGAFVVSTNASFGEDFADPNDYPLWCGIYDSLGSLGILNAGATINSFVDVDNVGDMPTACESDYLISVTNLSRLDIIGNAGYGSTQIDLGAPGTAVRSCIENNGYGDLTGTSMATPHVAGAVALLFAAGCDSFMQAYKANPAQTVLLIKQAILNGTDAVADLQGKTVSGGRLNLFKSIINLKNIFCSNCNLDIEVSTKNVSCNNGSDGEINIEVMNGVSPIIYNWSNGNSASRNQQLSAGSYTVDILDANGCIASVDTSIAEPADITINVTVQNTTNSEANGSATVGIIGGTPPYAFEWSTGENVNNTINNLDWGTYSITVTDAANCTKVNTFDVFSVSSVSNKNNSTQVVIYPNPASDYIVLENKNEKSHIATAIAITDVAGKLILEKKFTMHKQHTLLLQAMPKGIYFIQVKQDEEVNTFKLILQ